MKPPIRKLGRRRFLQGAGAATLALPFLRSLQAKGQPATPPLRFVVVYHGLGTLVDRWRPSGFGAGYGMSDLLRPLEAHRDDMLVVSGIENQMIRALEHGEVSHAAAAHSLLTAQPMEGVIGPDGRHTGIDTVDGRPPVGPSIDQVIADHIAAEAGQGLRSVHLAVGPSHPGEYAAFWRDRGGNQEWIANESDPRAAFNAIFAGVNPSEEPTELSLRDRLRLHSGSVLDSVRESYGRLERAVPTEDRLVLQAHAQLLRELEQNLDVEVTYTGSCSQPSLDTPGEDRWFDRVEHSTRSAQNQMEILSMALACDVTRVATLQFTHSHGQRFLDIPGYNVPGFGYGDWHAMVHNDNGQSLGDSLYPGYEWYSHRMDTLLSRMKTISDGAGTLLDNTIVLWISEFGDGGGHTVNDLPVGLFGGPIRKGEHLDGSGYSTNELFVGIAERFGLSLDSFGMESYLGESFTSSPLSIG